MLHATNFFVVTMILQNVILVNNFVNFKELKNSSFSIDKLLKLLNLNLKIFQRERFQFSKNNDELLTMWAINDLYFLSLQIFFESMLNKKNFDNHFEKQGSEDLFSLSRDFFTTSLIQINRNRFIENFIRNLFLNELQQLKSNIFKYNDHIRVFLFASNDSSDEKENKESFILIDDIIESSNMSVMNADIFDLFSSF